MHAGKNLVKWVGAALAAVSATTAYAAELSFWSWRVEDKAFYESVAKDYKARTGVDVKFVAYKNTEYPTVLSAALASGGGPDIIHARAYGAIATLADADYLVPLAKDKVPNLAGFSAELLAAAAGRKAPRDKQVFGVPFATQSLGIFYNNAVLAKAGITALPKTWDEFKATCRALKDKKIACLANGSKDAPGLEQMFGVVGPAFYGGTPFFDGVMAGKRKFTDPAFVKALEEVVALKEYMPANHMGVGENESRTLFAGGLAAFYMTGTWNIDTVRDLNAKADFGVMPAPPLAAGGPVYVSTFADGNYAVNAKSTQRDAALAFVDYLASRDFGQRFTTELRQLSPIAGVKAADPLLQGVAEASAKHGTPFLMLVGFRYQNPNGSVLLRDGIQKLMQGQGTSATLAQEIQTGLATWHRFQ